MYIVLKQSMIYLYRYMIRTLYDYFFLLNIVKISPATCRIYLHSIVCTAVSYILLFEPTGLKCGVNKAFSLLIVRTDVGLGLKISLRNGISSQI